MSYFYRITGTGDKALKKHFVFCIVFMTILISPVFLPVSSLHAEKMPTIKSRVLDAGGNPVQGAYIFFYDSPDTKRAVDLVSPVTGKNGTCTKDVPPGVYWALARLKKEGDFDMGPLMIGDRVSGEPREIEVSPGEELELEFTILNLLETIRLKSQKRKDLSQVTGRIVDADGEAVPKAFVFANRHKQPVTMPYYFSAWTDDTGQFTIFLPDGRYYLGAETSFTDDRSYVADKEVKIEKDIDGFEIVLEKHEEIGKRE